VSAVRGADGLLRCPWPGDDPLYLRYHDEEWGKPLRDDRALFELLLLEGAQAGLSWITVLRKRENYRAAFDGFDPEKIARYDEGKIASLLLNEGIVRNRLKVRAFVRNARAYLDLVETEGSFSRWIWSFVGGEPLVERRTGLGDVPAETEESRAMSRELKRRGFTFVGPTICYAFMQAAGLVNDHLEGCFLARH
jgi:DNA-3-methyladenine glycosylase I